VFEKMVLRKIPGPIREEATGRWRKLNNKIIICSPHQIPLD
jgi:hypothetical protein